MDNRIAQRFWDKVLIGDGCWEWQASQDTQGYGNFMIDRRARRAHRVAYELWHGVDPGEQLVLHACDNPACCNPQHLSLGTHQENMRQMSDRKRSAVGEAVHQSKLTAKNVLDIRARAAKGEKQAALAREYGVGETTLSYIVRRRMWKHV